MPTTQEIQEFLLRQLKWEKDNERAALLGGAIGRRRYEIEEAAKKESEACKKRYFTRHDSGSLWVYSNGETETDPPTYTLPVRTDHCVHDAFGRVTTPEAYAKCLVDAEWAYEKCENAALKRRDSQLAKEVTPVEKSINERINKELDEGEKHILGKKP